MKLYIQQKLYSLYIIICNIWEYYKASLIKILSFSQCRIQKFFSI